jgi:predicted DCC family thiol-disulfide oxidoreductase YuxK
MSQTKKSILLYDGTCGLCHWAVNLCRKHIIDKKSIRYCPQESDQGIELINEYKINTAIDSIYLVMDSKVYYKSQAAFKLIQKMRWSVKWILVLNVLPTSLLDALYDYVAKNRKKIFSEVDTCEL